MQLPDGASGEVVVDAAPAATYTITVAWPEIGQEEPATYTLTMQP